MIVRLVAFTAAGRRQDSVTGGGGGRNKFWGAQKLYLCKFKRGTGAREIYASVDQTKKIFSSKISTNSCYRLNDFSRIPKCRPKKKKKRSSSQKLYEIRRESTTVTKIRAVNTNSGVLGLDLHSNSSEPLNSSGHSPRLGGTIFVWGAQFSFGGHKQSFGGHRSGMPPVAPGLHCCR